MGSGPALELGFDTPGEIWFAVFVEDGVCDCGVDFLRVYEEAVHVEEACSDGWESSGFGLRFVLLVPLERELTREGPYLTC